MGRQIRYTPEQIISKLREAEVILSHGKTWTSFRKPTLKHGQ